MKPINVTNETQFVGENKLVTSDCFAITFKRPTGSTAVSVNGYPLAEGESLPPDTKYGKFRKTIAKFGVFKAWHSFDDR